MRKFLGTDREFLAELRCNLRKFITRAFLLQRDFTERFVPELDADERQALREIAVGIKPVRIHVDLAWDTERKPDDERVRDLMEFTRKIIDFQKPLDPDDAQLLNDHLFELT